MMRSDQKCAVRIVYMDEMKNVIVVLVTGAICIFDWVRPYIVLAVTIQEMSNFSTCQSNANAYYVTSEAS